MRLRSVLSAVAAFLSACSGTLAEPSAVGSTQPNLALGRIAFQQNCSSCHASGDGFDLALFGFTDTTIVRRAVKHVDTTTARQIVAYVRSLSTPRQPEKLRLFQPMGAPLASDVEFAVALFGRDAWPAELTSAGLAAINPRNVAIAVGLPIWSDEATNLDWMPDNPLPPEILGYAGGAASAAIAGYRVVPTQDNLLRAVNALRAADRAAANPGAPCLLDDSTRVDFLKCFEVRRWTSSLVALHVLRNGMDDNLAAQVHDVWWDVGNAARKSRNDLSVPVANPMQNWAAWMFLGWSFDPSQHASVYTGGGFRQLGLIRHATFVALRSQVARPPNSSSAFDDLVNAERFAPATWTTAVTTFGLRNLIERFEDGERPQNATDLASDIAAVGTAVAEADRKVPVADRAGLSALGQQLLGLLGK